jgi:hypothetical protein
MVHQDLSFWENVYLKAFSARLNQEGFSRSC